MYCMYTHWGGYCMLIRQCGLGQFPHITHEALSLDFKKFKFFKNMRFLIKLQYSVIACCQGISDWSDFSF